MAQQLTAIEKVLKEAKFVDSTSLEPGHYGHPLMLDRIFKLLVTMINVLQKTAAAQAKRLDFLTAWQKAYTEKMNQVHAFVANNGDHTAVVGTSLSNATDTTVAKIRESLNTANTTYTQQMQGNNGVISNDAKALQSIVNQTNDAVQSQTDIATSILQQMSTILTSIFQS